MFKRILVFLLLLLPVAPAAARWKAEYAAQPPQVRAWYESANLTEAAQKRLGFAGCCKYSDVVKAKFAVSRIGGRDEWFYQEPGKPWRRVPSDIVHWGEHAPDGQATLFVLSEDFYGNPKGTPTCFYPPDGGI